MSNRRYFPILKGREGELKSLRRLLPQQRVGLTPLIELQRVGWDFKANKPKKAIDAHLTKAVEDIGKRWGANDDFLLDALEFAGQAMPGGTQPIGFALDAARNAGLQAVPVTGPSRAAAERA